MVKAILDVVKTTHSTGKLWQRIHRHVALYTAMSFNMKEDLMLCSMGNGITICDRKVTRGGDYKKVAHISATREITWYENVTKLSREAVIEIRDYAKYAHPDISTSQDIKVFRTEPETWVDAA